MRTLFFRLMVARFFVKLGGLCKTPLFAQSRRQAQISILKIPNVSLWLKFWPSLALNKNEPFSKVSVCRLIALCLCFLAAVCLYSGAAWAIEQPEVLVEGVIVDWQRCGPEVHQSNSFQLDFLNRIERFDAAYSEWQHNGTEQADRWLRLAHDTFGQYRIEDVHGENGAFVLRGVLLRAECLAFAAVDRMVYGKEEAISLYEQSIKILQKVMLTGEAQSIKILTGEAKEQYERLPDFALQPVMMTDNTWMANPWTGYEAVGTGSKQVRARSDGSHRSLPQLRKRLAVQWSIFGSQHLDDRPQTELDRRAIATAFRPSIPGQPTQISSSEAARLLLSELCPWGVDMYFKLKNAGFTKQLDFRILRPFIGEVTPTYAKPGLTVLTEFYNSYQSIFSDSPDYVSYKIPPKISDMVLTTDQVPLRIKRAMDRIVGVETVNYSNRIHRFVEGNLLGHKTKPVRWIWVGNPTYNIWFFSPTIYDWGEKEWLWFWFTAVKVYFGGPLGILSVSGDEMINLFRSHIVSAYGEGPVDVELFSKIVVESYDKGPLMPSLIEKGEWLSPAAIARKIATPVFNAFAEQARKDAYDGINARNFCLGTSYSGDKIPPVMIRSSIVGLEDTPSNEYPRFVEVVRFFSPYPEISGNRKPHQKLNLRKHNPIYTMDRVSWWKFPEPEGSFQIVTSLAPRKQILIFGLTETTALAVAPDDQIRAELWHVTEREQEEVAAKPIRGDASRFLLEIYNGNNDLAVNEFHQPIPLTPIPVPLPRTTERAGMNSETPTPTPTPTPQEIPKNIVKKKDRVLDTPRTCYELRIVMKDKLIAKYLVNLDRGSKKQKKITGRLSSPKPGVVQLDYEPQIDIPVAKVKKGEVHPGKHSEE